MCEMLGVTFINRWHKQRNASSLLLLVIFFAASFLFLSLALQSLPMGTAYAVWTGLGTAGAAMLGMMFYGESNKISRLLFIGLILIATIGLKLVS
jgi:paired small multidrug resistance pump